MKRISVDLVKKGMEVGGIKLIKGSYAELDSEGNILCACALSQAFVGEQGKEALIELRKDRSLMAQDFAGYMELDRNYISGFVHGFDHDKDFNEGEFDPHPYKAGNQDGKACRVLLP